MNKIEKYITEENWDAARVEILEELKKDKDNHWLITRLSLTYYEEKKYKKALRYSEKAMKLAPECPLVLWDYAGTLDMMGNEEEAIYIYKKIIRKGINGLAYGECGEGLRWAKALYADCFYRLALEYLNLGQKRRAIKYLEQHLNSRGKGIPSIYKLRDVKKKYKQLIMGKY